MTQTKKRLLKVGLSGGIATVLDVATLVALVEVAALPVGLAAFLAAGTGAVAGFLASKFWAFKDRSPIDLRQVASYALVSLVTALVVAGSVHALAVGLGVPYLVAKAAAAALVFGLWSYPAQARIVFRHATSRVGALEPSR